MAKVNITQVRSRIGATHIQCKNLDALGLRRMGRTVQHEDSAIIMGMIEKVRHLVKIEMNAAPLAKKEPKKAAPKAAPKAEAKEVKAEPKAEKPAEEKAEKAAPKAAAEKKPAAAKKPAAPKAEKPAAEKKPAAKKTNE